MHENDAIPGNCIVLDRPYKPDKASINAQEIEKFLHDTGLSYNEWHGFQHGIILLYDGDRVCYVALYDVATGLMYLDIHEGIPVRVEFTLDEMALFKNINEWPDITSQDRIPTKPLPKVRG